MAGAWLIRVGLLLALAVTPGRAANILGLFSSHSQSHLILHMSMVGALAEAGHNVTVVSMVEPRIRHRDVHVIVIPATAEQERIMEGQLEEMAGQRNSILSTMRRLMSGMSVLIESQQDVLSDPRFQRIYETRFDLMFLGYFLNDFQLGVAARLRVPVIVAWMQTSMAVTDQLVGNPAELSYVPNIATPLARGQSMGLAKRAENLGKELFIRLMMGLLQHRAQLFYEEHFGRDPDFPTLSEMRRNVSMVFTNSHSLSEGPIRPLVPALVEIGGIQIKEQPDPLPADIAQFLDTARHGAILLSLGSNVKSTSIRPELMQAIFQVLSGLKERVIFKWEDLEHTPGESPNILYQQWLPQADILAHPQLKLFITHAGKGGITEAQYHGVPMLALPIFGDQPANAAIMQGSGYGLALDLLQLTEPGFRAAIDQLLGNRSYSLAIKRFSQLYRDRPLGPRQTVLFWTDYVLRHRGAAHLQSPAVHMGLVAYHNLDVYAVLLAGLASVLGLIWLAVR